MLSATVVALFLASLLEVRGAVLVAGEYELPGLCLWRMFASVACPTCGLTRGLVATAHGGWSRGFAFHPLAPVLYAVVVGRGLLAGARLMRARP